ncbi:MAG: hypothetical protein RLZZ200_3145 [Pseudomonadota bacterium]
MSERSRIWPALAAGVIVGLALGITASNLVHRRAEASLSRLPALPAEGSQLLSEVLERVAGEYVDDVPAQTLLDNAVRGLVAALDPHSQFLDADEYREIQEETAGSYPGIGIEVVATPRGIEVRQPIEGSPAAAAGLRIGDVIIAIDGREVLADATEKAIADMRGPAGSTVHITIRREGLSAPLDYDIQRAQVAVHSVSRQLLEPGIGFLRISTFNDTTAEDLRDALGELKRDARRPLAGLVIDLRNNPGGLLESAVEVADEFLERGNIVSAVGRSPEARFRRDAQPGDLLDGAPIVVLVNGNSASAAEILAGALKDNHRAQLVGRRSYGKGSVQTVLPLSQGRALKLTTSRYFTPSGASINQVGIPPDVVIEGEESLPAPLDTGAGPRTLAQRDPPVQLALDLLHKGH